MLSDPYTLFSRPPAHMGEVHRIWNEMHLGDTAYAWYILETLAVWVERTQSIYEINGEDYVAWILPNGSRFVSKGPAFLRWFFCGLQSVAVASTPVTTAAPISPPLQASEGPSDMDVILESLMLE